MTRILHVCFILFSALYCLAQEVTDKQWMLIQKNTADWCSNCGTWAWDFKEQNLEKYGEEDGILFWITHINSSGLKSETSVALATNFGGNRNPVFFLDGEDLQVSRSNVDSRQSEIDEAVETIKTFSPFYSSGVLATYDGSNIHVDAKVEFFEASGNNPVLLGIYLLRKETIAYQATRGNNAVHKNLVVDHLTEDVFGQELVASNGPKGSIYNLSASIELPNEDMSNYSIVSVLWNKDGDDYKFINANINEISIVSSTAELVEQTRFSITSISADNLEINVYNNSYHGNAFLQIHDLNGRLINKESINLHIGNNSSFVSLSQSMSGMYYVTLTLDESTRFTIPFFYQ